MAYLYNFSRDLQGADFANRTCTAVGVSGIMSWQWVAAMGQSVTNEEHQAGGLRRRVIWKPNQS